jgi:hypothetical protein
MRAQRVFAQKQDREPFYSNMYPCNMRAQRVFAGLALLKKVRKSEINELFYFEKAPIIRARSAFLRAFFEKAP